MESYSQAGQDKFVLKMLNGKKKGTYIEIGAFDPINISNTFLLEKDFLWQGFSLDIVEEYVRNFNNIRKNKSISADATNFNYEKEIKNTWGDINRIDYLSCDCEPAENTYKSLCAIPLEKYRFSVITFETDLYASGSRIRELSREKLQGLGYQLVASDVCNEGNPFEDWYIDPTYINENIWLPYVCEYSEGKSIC